MSRVVFRADASPKIGLGHLMRVAAIAEKIDSLFECVLAVESLPEAVVQQVRGVFDIIEFFENKTSFQTFLLAEDIVVFDGYHFDNDYQLAVRTKVRAIVFIDDFADRKYVADVVINHAPGLDPGQFQAKPSTRIFLGPSYAMVRNVFIEASKKDRQITEIDKAFVCFGGADVLGLGARFALEAAAISQLKEIHLVIGGANSAFSEKKISHQKISWHKNLSSHKMVELMESCSLAIVPSSSILLEVLSVRMPVISGYYTRNQALIYNGYEELQMIHGIGDFRHMIDFESYLDDYLKKIDASQIIKRQLGCHFELAQMNFQELFASL